MTVRVPDTQVICITPVRNEAWILDRFLSAAELWADHIVLADQGSTDDTREIAAGFGKVRVIANESPGYDEGARQRLLLEAAREVPGRRLIVALDADEALTSDTWKTPEWRAALAAEPGTVLAFEWVNLLPGRERVFVPRERVSFAFVDDERDHAGARIHSTRVPVGSGAPILEMDAVKVLHLQYTAWKRMESKQRWYQAWERINHPEKRPIQIFRQYNRMLAFPEEELRPYDPAWLEGYRERGIELDEHPDDSSLWWDEEVAGWLVARGTDPFRRIDLWDVDWPAAARAADLTAAPGALADPRSRFERYVHRWLRATQRKPDARSTRFFQRLLIPLGW
jgi:glycosyltransferase involved in cell wall biosynthesis